MFQVIRWHRIFNVFINNLASENMCGYCIERTGVLETVEGERFTDDIERHAMFESAYLQESKYFPQIITVLKEDGIFSGQIEIVMYRLWETLLFGQGNKLFDAIICQYGMKSIDAFLSKLKDSHQDWEFLGNIDTYTNMSTWEKCTKHSEQLVEKAQRTLALYLDWWIESVDRRPDTPIEWDSANMAIEANRKKALEELDKFYSAFPFVYFSLLVLIKYQRNSPLISDIALGSPKRIPDFSAYDLWLQRVALTSSLKEYGVNFLLDNHARIRLELLYYCVARFEFSRVELDEIKEHLLSNDSDYDGELDTEPVIELIVRLADGQWARPS